MNFFRTKPHRNHHPVTPGEIEAARQRTLKLSVRDGVAWSVMVGFGDMYLSPFAVFLKASNWAIGFLTTMPPLLGALAQMAGAHWADRIGRRRDLIVPLIMLHAIAFLPIYFVPFFFRAAAVPALILFAALGVLFNMAAAPIWTSMMGEVVPENARGDYWGRRSRVLMLTVLLASLTAGGTLYLFQQAGRIWTGFGILFCVAFVARIISALFLERHYDPPYAPGPESHFSFWAFIRRMPHSNFARYALYFSLMMGASNIAAPFFTVYMLRDLKWDYAHYTLSQALFLLTQVFLVGWWGRIGDRHGNRVVIAATSFILPLLPFLWLVSTNYYYLLGVQLVSGIGWSGFTIAAQNFTFDAVSIQKRARVAAYVSVLHGFCMLAGGTLIGAPLANHLPSAYSLGPVRIAFLSSLPSLFAVSGLARFAVAVLLLKKFKEVRSGHEHIHPMVLILRLAGGSLLAGFVSGLLKQEEEEDRRDG
ncbi:MAG: MFS transporter [Kiritimatiellia bacterium]